METEHDGPRLRRLSREHRKDGGKARSRKASTDHGVTDVPSTRGASRATSFDSGAGVDDDESCRFENSDKEMGDVGQSGNEPRVPGAISQTSLDRDGIRNVSVNRKPDHDSPVSITSAAAMSVVSPSAESGVLSSPSPSDRSMSSTASPRRSRSPELSKALRLKQEYLRRENDLAETRSRLKLLNLVGNVDDHGVGAESTHDVAVVDKSKHSKRSLERAKSVELAKLKYAEKIALLNGKSSSNSLGTIRDMEERYTRRHNRSKSEKRHGEKSAFGQKSKAEKYNGDRSENCSLRDSTETSVSSRRPKLGDKGYRSHRSSRSIDFADNVSLLSSNLESVRESAVILSVCESISDSRPQSFQISNNIREDSHSLAVAADGDFRILPSPPSTAKAPATDPLGLQKSSVYTVHIVQKRADNDTHAEPVPSLQGLKQTEHSLEIIDRTKEVEERTMSALDAILKDNLPPIPSIGDTNEGVLLDWRRVFRVEMIRLRREVNDFRQFCLKQVELNALSLSNPRSDKPGLDSGPTKNILQPVMSRRVSQHIQNVDGDLKMLQRRQSVLDLETELLSKEGHLAERQKGLEEYEKEIIEVESLLNQRQAICDRRQKALLNLDEELQILRHELEETKEQIQSDGSIPESNSDRARKNWDMVRRNLMDKQHLLESTVQKYRSELASATSTIAGKDILIARLQSTAIQHEEELVNKDKRIKQLETKLALTVSEARNLADQLTNHSYRDMLGSTNYSRGEHSGDYNGVFVARRPSQELIPEHARGSYRSSMYRRPSNNAGSDQGEEYKPVITAALDHDAEQFRNGSRIVRKRNSISDNAISRLTLSTPRSDDKYGRGSSACSVQ